jgi:hypothetical protein
MEVSSNQVKPKNLAKNGKVSLSKAEIEAKIKARFGDKAKKKSAPKKPKPPEVALGKSSKEVGGKAVTGDVGANDPKAEMTQEKLKFLLKSGSSTFNDRERKVLANILK